MKIYLWEILVPATTDGKEISVLFHQEWDKKANELVGGLSIMKSMKGQWVNPNAEIFAEKMIPVRIACSIGSIYDITKFTRDYYNQEIIMVYKVSDMVLYIKQGMSSLEEWPSL